jgi:hypothetical protein
MKIQMLKTPLAVLLLAGLAYTPAQALAPAGPISYGQSMDQASVDGIQYVANKQKRKKWYYNRHRHGPRYHHRRNHYTHYHNGYWYAQPWWLPGFAITIAPGIGIGSGSAHVRWCENRYRSYNPSTNRYLGYDGYYHRCNSPYD